LCAPPFRISARRVRFTLPSAERCEFRAVHKDLVITIRVSCQTFREALACTIERCSCRYGQSERGLRSRSLRDISSRSSAHHQ
jgi:hypothetical protein